jgi:hypothetical protein
VNVIHTIAKTTTIPGTAIQVKNSLIAVLTHPSSFYYFITQMSVT